MKNLIFDRTQLDIDNDTEKGQYTYTDLNRVESWCKYLANVLNSYNYYIEIKTKTDWKESDYHYSEDLERIRNNINRLKQAYFSFTQIPENLEYMTIEKANAIEKILSEIDYLIRGMENNFVYSGVAGCGQIRFWQQRFRRKYSYFRSKTWEELTQIYWNAFTKTDTWEGVSLIENNTEL